MTRLDPSSRWYPLFLVLLVMAGAVSTDMYLPSLPDLVRLFHTSVSRVQFTLSIFFVGFSVAQLVLGPLSDRFGRRPVLMWGIALYILGTLICLAAPGIEVLIGGRFLQALGACSGPVLSRAIVRDVYPRDQAARIFATMASIFALTPALAPIIGGNLHVLFGWKANFIAMLAFGATQYLGVRFLLKETNERPDRNATKIRRLLFNYWTLARKPVFLRNTLMVVFMFSAMFTFISGLPFIIIGILGIAPDRFGFYMAATLPGFLTGSLSVARLTPRLGSERLATLGVLLGLAAALALAGLAWAGVQTAAAVMVPASVLFLASALVMPSATALAVAPFPRIAGAASALLGFLQMAVAAFAGWLGGALHDGTTIPVTSVMLGAVAAAVAVRFLPMGKSPRVSRPAS